MRLLSATHKDLGAEVQAGQFRQDLYYRLNVIQIRVPPLRERLEDLMGISERVLERLARDAGVWPAPRLTRDALRPSVALSVPGQRARAREPAAPRGRAVRRARSSTSTTSACPESVFTDSAAQELDQIAERGRRRSRSTPRQRAAWRRSRSRCRTTSPKYLDDVERDILVRALEHHRFNRTAAGISLGLSLRQMRYRMARLNVNVGGDAGVERETRRVTRAQRLARRLAAARARRCRRRTSGRDRRQRRSTSSCIHSISLPPGEYGGDAIERLFTNRLDWDAHPVLRDDPRPARSRRTSSSAATAS